MEEGKKDETLDEARNSSRSGEITYQVDHGEGNHDISDGTSGQPDGSSGEEEGDLGDVVDDLEPDAANAGTHSLKFQPVEVSTRYNETDEGEPKMPQVGASP